MDANTPVYRRLIAGVGGVVLIISLFLPWASLNGVAQTGWEFNKILAGLFLVAGVFGLVTAATGGRHGVGRPDLSFISATDLLNTVSMGLLIWHVLDFPENATRLAGVYLALISASATAFAVADYRPLQGALWFPIVSNEVKARASIPG